MAMNTPMFADTLVLAPTFFRYEHYIDALMDLLDLTWPGHPEVYFFSDKTAPRKVAYRKIIRSQRSEWPHVVYNGCVEIKQRYPHIRKILMLNEEAFPLTPVNTNKIRKILDICIQEKLDYAYFPPYEHTWTFDHKIGGEAFCITPSYYPYYTQLGPAFWDIDHLVNTCRYAIDNNILSPWKVEGIVTGSTHYITDYNWPTVADGLFKDGFVNLNALKIVSTRKVKIKQVLLKDYLFSRPKKLYRLLLRKSIGAANKVLGKLNFRPLVYPYRS